MPTTLRVTPEEGVVFLEKRQYFFARAFTQPRLLSPRGLVFSFFPKASGFKKRRKSKGRPKAF